MYDFILYISLFQVFLDHRNADEVLMLVATKTNGATPLVMACRNGHYHVVEYLVDRCHANIEQPGSGRYASSVVIDIHSSKFFLITLNC